MKKNLLKGLLLIVLSVVLLGTSTVFAADSDYDELFNFGTDDSTTTNTQEPTTTNPTTTTEPTTTTTEPTTTTTDIPTGNSSVYNNNTTPTTPVTTETKEDKKLSDTGIEDTLPMVSLIVVFGISAVVAYKKINEYKNV